MGKICNIFSVCFLNRRGKSLGTHEPENVYLPNTSFFGLSDKDRAEVLLAFMKEQICGERICTADRGRQLSQSAEKGSKGGHLTYITPVTKIQPLCWYFSEAQGALTQSVSFAETIKYFSAIGL